MLILWLSDFACSEGRGCLCSTLGYRLPCRESYSTSYGLCRWLTSLPLLHKPQQRPLVSTSTFGHHMSSAVSLLDTLRKEAPCKAVPSPLMGKGHVYTLTSCYHSQHFQLKVLWWAGGFYPLGISLSMSPTSLSNSLYCEVLGFMLHILACWSLV